MRSWTIFVGYESVINGLEIKKSVTNLKKLGQIFLEFSLRRFDILQRFVLHLQGKPVRKPFRQP